MAEIKAALTIDAGPAKASTDQLGTSALNAAKAVDTLSASQRELIAKSDKVAALANTIDIQNKKAVSSYLQQVAQVRALAQQIGVLDEVQRRTSQGAQDAASHQAALIQQTKALRVETGLASAAQNGLGASTNLAGVGLGRLRGSVTSLAASMLGAVPGVTQLGSAVGTMALGAGTTIAILAGIAAIAAVYDLVTKRAREAKEAAEAFQKTDAGFAATNRAQSQESAVTGSRAFSGGLFRRDIDVAGQTKQIDDMRKALRGFRDELNSSDTGNIGIARFGAVNQQLIALRRELAAGHLSVEQFQHGLTALDRAFPGFEREILQSRELGNAFDEAAKAAKRLQAEASNAAAEARSLIATHGQPGTSFDQGGQDAVKLAQGRKALEDAQARANAANAGGSLGVQKIDDQREAIDKATEKWKEYVVATGNATLANTAYTDALGHHNAAATQFLKDSEAEIAANEQVTRTIALRADLTRGNGDVTKQRALNDAFKEGAEAVSLLAIHYDALNKKKQDALTHTPAEIALLNATTDAMAAQQARAVLLAGTRQRSESVRDANQAADAAATSAEQERSLVGLSTEAIARKRIEYAALNALTAAHNKLLADQAHADAAEKQAADDRYQAQVRAINANRGRDVAGLDVSTSSTTDAMKESREAIEAENAALLSGATARKGYEIDLRAQLDLKKAEQIINPALRADREKEIENTRQASQEHRVLSEAMQKVEERAKQIGHTVGTTISSALDALSIKGQNFFQAWWDAGKRGLDKFIGDAFGTLAEQKFAENMGVGPGAAATKQVTAGATMLSAAQMQLQAAAMMAGGVALPGGWGISTGAHGGVADASVAMNGGGAGGVLGYGAIIAGAGLTGYGIGSSLYSTSHGAFGNYARGGVGGAAAGAGVGAALGTAVFPGIGTAAGAAIGALVGFTAGLFGVAGAAKASAAQVRSMREALDATMEGYRASVTGDSLAASKAQAHAEAAAIRKQIEDAYSGGGANSDTVRQRNALLDETNRLELQRIANLEAEAAAIKKNAQEDLDVRTLRNQGRQHEADVQQKINEDAREYAQAVKDGFDAAYLTQLKWNQKTEEAAVAAGKAADALNSFTTSLHNAPTGFKVEPYTYQYGTPAQRPAQPGQWTVPTNPFVPPTTPLNAPTLSKASATSASKSMQVVFNIDGTKATRTLTQDIARELRKIADETLGPAADTVDAWGELA